MQDTPDGLVGVFTFHIDAVFKQKHRYTDKIELVVLKDFRGQQLQSKGKDIAKLVFTPASFEKFAEGNSCFYHAIKKNRERVFIVPPRLEEFDFVKLIKDGESKPLPFIPKRLKERLEDFKTNNASLTLQDVAELEQFYPDDEEVRAAYESLIEGAQGATEETIYIDSDDSNQRTPEPKGTFFRIF